MVLLHVRCLASFVLCRCVLISSFIGKACEAVSHFKNITSGFNWADIAKLLVRTRIFSLFAFNSFSMLT